MKKKESIDMVGLVVNGLILFVIIFAVSNLLTYVQRSHYPVVESMEITDHRFSDDGNILINGVLTKSPWASSDVCAFDRLEVSMQTPIGWERINVEFYDQPDNASKTRNPGQSVFGEWKLMSKSNRSAKHFRFDAWHNCVRIPAPKFLKLDLSLVQARSTHFLQVDSD